MEILSTNWNRPLFQRGGQDSGGAGERQIPSWGAPIPPARLHFHRWLDRWWIRKRRCDGIAAPHGPCV